MTENTVRDVCLRPFDMGWEPPTADEVRYVLKKANLTGAAAARLTGIKDSRTVRRWTGGETPILFSPWAILCDVAGLGQIWKK